MERQIVASNDTIVAPASGAGRAAVAVIRLSGPQARRARGVMRRPAACPSSPPCADIGPPHWSLIDRGLVLWFPAPASFTGEDMAELQVHGSRAVIRAAIDAMLSLDGVRLAEPGEFARRAFENGKLDLTEVEGLADLVQAETEAQRASGAGAGRGLARALYESWRERASEGPGAGRGRARFRRRGRCRSRMCRRKPGAIAAALLTESRAARRRAAASGCATGCASSSPARPMPASRAC